MKITHQTKEFGNIPLLARNTLTVSVGYRLRRRLAHAEAFNLAHRRIARRKQGPRTNRSPGTSRERFCCTDAFHRIPRATRVQQRTVASAENSDMVLGLNFDLLDQLSFYGAYHRHPVNKAIHLVFVPCIIWSALVWMAGYVPEAAEGVSLAGASIGLFAFVVVGAAYLTFQEQQSKKSIEEEDTKPRLPTLAELVAEVEQLKAHAAETERAHEALRAEVVALRRENEALRAESARQRGVSVDSLEGTALPVAVGDVRPRA